MAKEPEQPTADTGADPAPLESAAAIAADAGGKAAKTGFTATKDKAGASALEAVAGIFVNDEESSASSYRRMETEAVDITGEGAKDKTPNAENAAEKSVSATASAATITATAAVAGAAVAFSQARPAAAAVLQPVPVQEVAAIADPVPLRDAAAPAQAIRNQTAQTLQAIPQDIFVNDEPSSASSYARSNLDGRPVKEDYEEDRDHALEGEGGLTAGQRLDMWQERFYSQDESHAPMVGSPAALKIARQNPLMVGQEDEDGDPHLNAAQLMCQFISANLNPYAEMNARFEAQTRDALRYGREPARNHSDFRNKSLEDLRDVAVHNGVGNSPQLERDIHRLQTDQIAYKPGDSDAAFLIDNISKGNVAVHNGQIIKTDAELQQAQKEAQMSFADPSLEGLNRIKDTADAISGAGQLSTPVGGSPLDAKNVITAPFNESSNPSADAPKAPEVAITGAMTPIPGTSSAKLDSTLQAFGM